MKVMDTSRKSKSRPRERDAVLYATMTLAIFIRKVGLPPAPRVQLKAGVTRA